MIKRILLNQGNDVIYKVFLLLFLTGCAGFYKQVEGFGKSRRAIEGVIITSLNITYIQDGVMIDEVGMKDFPHLNQKANFLRENFFNYLKNDYINDVRINSDSKGDQGCVLEVFLQEVSNPRDMIPAALTLGLFPYVGTHTVNINSKLRNRDKIVKELNSEFRYKIGFSLFFIPLAPFMTIKDAEQSAYRDAFYTVLDGLNFEGCKNE